MPTPGVAIAGGHAGGGVTDPGFCRSAVAGPRNEMGSRLSTKGRLEYRAEGFAHYSSKVRILE
jgi:hypothetical protein